MTRPPLLIVQTGRTFPSFIRRWGDFDRWFRRRLDGGTMPVAVVRPFAGQPLPAPEGLGGVIVTGSHAMVTDGHAWSEATALWLRGVVAAKVPVLGVCYGHQLLAHALGGKVTDNPPGREFGTVTVQLTPAAAVDPLLAGQPAVFAAQASHTQCVATLPPGAIRLGASPRDPHQIFAWGGCAWGLQFHPEFDAAVTRAYIRSMAEALAAEGQNVAALLAGVCQTPHSAALLRRFARLCQPAGV